MTGRIPDHTRVFTNGYMVWGYHFDFLLLILLNHCRSGLREPVPASARFTNFREAMPNGMDVKSIPQWFREHNYYATGAGKVIGVW